MWGSSETDIDVGAVIFESGGHGWLPYTTELVSEFFYNHPPRDVALRIDFSRLKQFYTTNESIKIRPELHESLSPEKISKMQLFINGKMVRENSNPPYDFDYKYSEPMQTRISMKAILKDGRIIGATNPVNIWITRENITGESIATSSGNEDDSLSPENAVDGNLYSRWSSPWSDPQWLEIDLKKEKMIDGFTIIWETAFARAFVIEASKDGVTWQNVYQQFSGDGGTDFIKISPVSARFLKLTGTGRATRWGYSLWEFMVHGEQTSPE